MTQRARLKVMASVLIGTVAGCANVKVHKVDVQDRLQGRDQKVEGFRYYLNRPYLVIAKQVPVATSYIPVSLAAAKMTSDDKGKKPGENEPLLSGTMLFLIAEAPQAETGQYMAFNLQGIAIETPANFEKLGSKPSALSKPGESKIDAERVVTAIKDAVTARLKATNKFTDPELKDAGVTVEIAARGTSNINVTKLGAHETFDEAKLAAATLAIKKANELLNAKAPGMKIDLEPKALADGLKEADFTATPKPAPAPGAVARMAPAAFVATPSAGKKTVVADTTDPNADPTADAKTPTDPPAVQVVFLPDFEEQYAIQNRNVLAKTKYNYKFTNGTELTSISGSYNATDVPVKIIETFGKLIEAAGSVAKTRINPTGSASTSALLDQSVLPNADFYIKVQQVLEPGMYRVQKSWERTAVKADGGVGPEEACGLFYDLGLPLVTSTSVINAQQHETETNPSKGTGKN